MRYPAVYYVRTADASQYRPEAAFDLRDHASADDALVDAVLNVLLVKDRNYVLFAFRCCLENAADIREDD